MGTPGDSGIRGGPGVPNALGPWALLGPAPVTGSFFGGANTGRVDGVAVVQSGPNAGKIFIGTAGGGVWSSTDNGASWTSHTDQLAAGLAIGAIAVDPTNSSVIYAGTGEDNNCGDCFYGGGVLKSTDGGNSWVVENPGGVFTGVHFASLAVDPNSAQTLYATTSAGFYISTDGGSSWAHPTGTGDVTDPSNGLALDPTTTPTTVYVATVHDGLQTSTDGGVNFTALGGGLPAAANFGVTALAIGSGATGHLTLYAAVQLVGASDPNGGDLSMYKSTNGGSSWSHLTIPAYTNATYAFGSGTADQADYDNTLAVDPVNPLHVIAGGIAVVETTDGGSSWSNINGQNFYGVAPNVIHPDFHAITFSPLANAVIGCDGGVYEYAGGGRSGVSNLNSNQATAQVYQDLGVYANGAEVLAGLQDNGTALYSSGPAWPDEEGGDGGYSAINPLDSAQQYLEGNQHVYVTSDHWATSAQIDPPGGVNGNFVSPLVVVPNRSVPDAPAVYYGGADLWRSGNPTDGTPSWSRLTSVGTKVSAIAVAPSNPNVMYVGFDDGTLLISLNATSSAPTFSDITPAVSNWITHIDVDPGNPGSIAVSFSAGSSHSFSVPPMVQMGAVTLTGAPSASYTDITGNLPSGVASNSVVFDGGALVVATDVGVFLTVAPNGGSTSWSALGTALPNVQVLGLSVDTDGDLFAATHGRGVWKLRGSGSTLTVTVGGTGTGTVTGAGIACPGTCTSTYPTGTHVTVTPQAGRGSQFAGWSGGGCSGTGACTLTLGNDQALKATFTAQPACTLTPRSTHVLAAADAMTAMRHKKKQRKGLLKLTVRCAQDARVTLRGTVFAIGRKKHAHKRRFTVSLVRSSVRAGRTYTMTVKLPGAALAALRSGARESVDFALTATNGNGTSQANATIKRLRRRRR